MMINSSIIFVVSRFLFYLSSKKISFLMHLSFLVPSLTENISSLSNSNAFPTFFMGSLIDACQTALDRPSIIDVRPDYSYLSFIMFLNLLYFSVVQCLSISIVMAISFEKDFVRRSFIHRRSSIV